MGSLPTMERHHQQGKLGPGSRLQPLHPHPWARQEPLQEERRSQDHHRHRLRPASAHGALGIGHGFFLEYEISPLIGKLRGGRQQVPM